MAMNPTLKKVLIGIGITLLVLAIIAVILAFILSQIIGQAMGKVFGCMFTFGKGKGCTKADTKEKFEEDTATENEKKIGCTKKGCSSKLEDQDA
mgnify:CR=1 FL=1|jgi:hypothetical protein